METSRRLYDGPGRMFSTNFIILLERLGNVFIHYRVDTKGNGGRIGRKGDDHLFAQPPLESYKSSAQHQLRPP